MHRTHWLLVWYMSFITSKRAAIAIFTNAYINIEDGKHCFLLRKYFFHTKASFENYNIRTYSNMSFIDELYNKYYVSPALVSILMVSFFNGHSALFSITHSAPTMNTSIHQYNRIKHLHTLIHVCVHNLVDVSY